MTTATKPKCKLTGTDGNVFAIIGRVSRALQRACLNSAADEFESKANRARSYDEVLQLCFEYVDVE